MDEGKRTIAWASEAREALDDILSFIAADSPEAARKVLEVVLAAAESLCLFAKRGRMVPELRQDDIREIFVYRYRLIYQVSSTEVRVLAILHGAMDFGSWLN